MLEILRASLEDSETISQCTKEAYSDEIFKFSDKNKVNEYPTPDSVRYDIEHLIYYKIVLDNNIIGGVFIEEKGAQTAEIGDFCIVSYHQNKGYGKYVLNYLEHIHSDIKKMGANYTSV